MSSRGAFGCLSAGCAYKSKYPFSGEFFRNMAVEAEGHYLPFEPTLSLEDLLDQIIPQSDHVARYHKKSTTSLLKALALTTSALIAISSFTGGAHAIDRNWVGNVSGDFNNVNNFDDATGALTNADNIDVGVAAFNNNAPTLSGNVDLNTLDVSGANGDLTLDLGANTLTTVGNATLDQAGNTVAINGAGGTLTVGGTFAVTDGTVNVDTMQAGSYNIDGGTISTTLRALAAPTSTVTVDIDGGVFSNATQMLTVSGNNQTIDIDITGATVGSTSDDVIFTVNGTANTTITTASALNNNGAAGSGIDAQSSDGDIDITANANVSGREDAVNANATGAGDVTVAGTGNLIGTGANSTGIVAQSASGAVTVSGTGATTATGTGIGIDVEIAAASEQITITRSGTVTGGTGGGIEATHNGDGDISITGIGDVSATGDDIILADALTGNVTVTTGGNIDGNGAIRGIYGNTAGAGTVDITLSAGNTIGTIAANEPSVDGIRSAAGSGTTTINVNGTVNSGGVGINADSDGATGIININLGTNGRIDSTGGTFGIDADTTGGAGATITVDGSSGDIVGGTDGLNLTTAGAQITVSDLTSVTGNAGDGIEANSNGGGITVSNVETITGTGGNGILADSDGGNIDIQGVGTTNNGNGFGVQGTTGDGINVDASGGGNITIGTTSANGIVNGQTDGIVAVTNGIGTIDITADGAVSGNTGDGIVSQAQNGNTTITTNALVTGAADAIHAASTGGGTVTVNVNNGATAGISEAVEADSNTGAIEITNAAGSTLQSTTLRRAISAESNAGVMQTVTNSGNILGTVLSNSGAMTFTNNAGGIWDPAHSDGGVITNAFGTGTDTLNNAGTLRIFDNTNAAVTQVTFSGLESFTNTGTIDLQNGAGTASQDTDSLTVTADTGNTDFTGGGTIKLDTFAGAGGSDSDTVTIGSAANDGRVTGATTLIVNNTNAGNGTIGATIPLVTVVDGAGTSTADNFTLQGGRVVSGDVEYVLQLVDNAGDDVFQLLGQAISGPDENTQDKTGIISGSFNVFHEAVNAMVDRQGDVRDNVAEYGKSGGFWMHSFGSVIDRTNRGSASAGGITTTSDTSFDQYTYGLYVGVDKAFKGITKDSDYLMVGVYGGYLGSNVRYQANSSKIDYDGGTIGAYSTYIDGIFYLDTLVKADFLEASIFDGPTNASDKTDLVNLGGRIGFGYKIQMNQSSYFDPFGKLTYASTSVDDYTIGANSVSIDTSESLRGQFGARLGTNFEEDGNKIDVFITASLIHDFDGKTAGTVTNTVTNVVSEENDITLVNLGLGIDVETPAEGINFYARANTDIGDDYFGYSGKFGFNVKL